MTVAELAQLMTIASQLSGLPLPADHEMPLVFFEKDAEVQRGYCSDRQGCGAVYAYTDRKRKEVHVSDQLDNYSVQTIVVHEFTHWLQFKDGVNQDDLVGFCFNEKLAQDTEAKYMLQYEHKVDPSTSAGPWCDVIIRITLRKQQ